MIKKLWPHARPYAKWVGLGVVCSASEAIFELLIPLVMSDIVDVGIASGDQTYIMKKGVLMVVLALVSLFFGQRRVLRGGGAGLRRKPAPGGVRPYPGVRLFQH